MAVPVLVLPPRYTNDSNDLWRAAVAADWDIVRLPNWRVPGELKEELRGREVALYGEPLFVAVVAEALGREPVEPPLDFLATVPFELRERGVGFGTLAEARELAGPVFIKPASEKTFEAKVYSSGAALPPLDTLEPETAVLWSEPVLWTAEFRCFICEGAVLTISPYWRGSITAQSADGSWPATVEELESARDFAGRVIAVATLPPAVVLDVGVIAGRGWAVIEANPAFGCGLYGCDATEVLKVLQRASQ